MITRFIFSFIAGIVNLVLGSVIIGSMIGLGMFMDMTKGLPSYEELKRYNPPTLSRVYNKNGQIVDELAFERRIFASYEDVPTLLIEAVISAEDKNFFKHSGYDPRAIVAAIHDVVMSMGEDVRGASTITQQVMKNFLLTSERSIERKVREIVLAYRVEQALSKEDILELYLNEIFFGQNSYGVAAAALTYFNKPLADLTLAEVAYLAGLPQKPVLLHPVRYRDEAIKRRNYVLGQMRLNGYISDEDYRQASAEPLKTVQSGDIPGFREQIPSRTYATEDVRLRLANMFGEQTIRQGGLRVEMTVDEELDSAAQTALRNGLLRLDRQAGIWRGTGLQALPEDTSDDLAWGRALDDLPLVRDMPGWVPATVVNLENAGAYVAVERGEGVSIGFVPARESQAWSQAERGGEITRVRGLGDMLARGDVIYVEAGSGEYEGYPVWQLRQVPKVEGGFLAIDVKTGDVLAMQGGFSFERSNFNRVTQAMRQTGSSFKPFLYAAALEQGYTPASMFNDREQAITVGDDVWRPKNASGRTYGIAPMRTGLERSLNLLTVDIGQSIGMEAIAEMSERLGVYQTMRRFPANMLGSQETTLWDMVRAYAVFASGGEQVDMSSIARILDRHGNVVYEHGPVRCVRCRSGAAEIPRRFDRPVLLSPVTAYQITDMLEGVVERGTASRIELPAPIAGKTGTTNDARDVWFVGYSSRIVAGCYVGFDTPTPMGRGVGGGSVCAPIFQEFMEQALEKYPGEEFETPPGGAFSYFAGGRPVSYMTDVFEFAPIEMLSPGVTTTPGVGQPPASGLGTSLPRVVPDQPLNTRPTAESMGAGGLY